MIGTHFHNSVSDVKDNNVKGIQYDYEITHLLLSYVLEERIN
jgi:hypothetical protein